MGRPKTILVLGLEAGTAHIDPHSVPPPLGSTHRAVGRLAKLAGMRD